MGKSSHLETFGNPYGEVLDQGDAGTPVRKLSGDERLAEVARILARGILRLQKLSCGNSAGEKA